MLLTIDVHMYLLVVRYLEQVEHYLVRLHVLEQPLLVSTVLVLGLAQFSQLSQDLTNYDMKYE